MEKRELQIFRKYLERRGLKLTSERRTTYLAKVGILLTYLTRTFALKLSVFLHVVALAAAGLLFWIRARADRPLPRIELVC